MGSRLHLLLAVLPVILALIGPIVTAQTTEDPTTGTAADGLVTESPDPCADLPCNGTANTECVAIDDVSYLCECLAGYSLNSEDDCAAIQMFTGGIEVTTVGGSPVTYSAALANSSTSEFQTLADEVKDAMDAVYAASSLAEVYMDCVVTGFTNGSVVAAYKLMFAVEDSSGPVNLTIDTLTTAFTGALAAEASNLNIAVDDTTIVFGDYDECASSDDNNCDVNANCTNIEGSFTCECHPDFSDVSPNLPAEPGRQCFAPTVAPNTACLSSPCWYDDELCIPVGENDYTCTCHEGYEYDAYWQCKPVGRETDFRCYKCQDSIDNVHCNGRHESENGSASLCPRTSDTCYTTIQMNPDGDGMMIRKGCMDIEECYDLMYSNLNDPTKASCFNYVFPYGDDTHAEGGVQCHYCCSEYFPLDLCNHDAPHFLYGALRVNSWDPRMNWDLTLDYSTPEPESKAVRHLSLVWLSCLVSAVLVYLLH